MTGNEYQNLAMRTAPLALGFEEQLLNGLMGMCGESGEAIDLMKKYLFQGHKVEREHLGKELGDVLWYISLAAHALDYTMDEIMQMNIDKLKKRYPVQFDPERSMHREADDV